MFDIGFLELLLIAVVALLVLGPERLPGAIRTGSLWLSKIRRSFQQFKLEIERELDTEELKRQLHNDSIMQTLEHTKSDIENNLQGARDALNKQLGDTPYNIDDLHKPQQQQEDDGTLPPHDPLPDVYGVDADDNDTDSPGHHPDPHNPHSHNNVPPKPVKHDREH